MLRLFGARIGDGVLIKPGLHVKYPWRLTVGDDCWLGERAWIDNMEDVVLASDVVLSQGAYLCTGNHRLGRSGDAARAAASRSPSSTAPWIGAFAKVAPGTTVRAGSSSPSDASRFRHRGVGIYAGNRRSESVRRAST